jgi:hypothetical protein
LCALEPELHKARRIDLKDMPAAVNRQLGEQLWLKQQKA